MRHAQRILCATALLAGAALVGSHATGVQAAGTTRYVCHPGTHSPAGCYPTIQSAINASNPGDKIIVFAGTYNENLDVPAANSPLTLIGSGTVIVDGVNPGGPQPTSILTVEPGAVVSVTHFTFTRGNYAYGGGVHNLGTLSLTYSLVTQNVTFPCGTAGIYNDGTYGAAMLTLTYTPVTKNLAGCTGGIANYYSTAILRHSPVSQNATGFLGTGGDGGGLWNYGGNASLQLTDSDVTGNSVGTDGQGAGIYTQNYATLKITNSVISGNTGGSGSQGGGIWHDATGSITLTGVKITGNNVTLSGDGGGVYNAAFEDTTCSAINKTNSTISGNTPDDCS